MSKATYLNEEKKRKFYSLTHIFVSLIICVFLSESQLERIFINYAYHKIYKNK